MNSGQRRRIEVIETAPRARYRLDRGFSGERCRSVGEPHHKKEV
jgi:hypothetical protein